MRLNNFFLYSFFFFHVYSVLCFDTPREIVSGNLLYTRGISLDVYGQRPVYNAQYRNMIQHIYSPKHYYERAMTFLREYKMPKTVRVPLDFQSMIAICRSSILLGFFGKERFQYWKILSWTIFYQPRLFPLAITFAIYGHHFRKISKLNNLQSIKM